MHTLLLPPLPLPLLRLLLLFVDSFLCFLFGCRFLAVPLKVPFTAFHISDPTKLIWFEHDFLSGFCTWTASRLRHTHFGEMIHADAQCSWCSAILLHAFLINILFSGFSATPANTCFFLLKLDTLRLMVRIHQSMERIFDDTWNYSPYERVSNVENWRSDPVERRTSVQNHRSFALLLRLCMEIFGQSAKHPIRCCESEKQVIRAPIRPIHSLV